MFIIQLLDEPCQCVVGLVDVHLSLTLEVFFIQQLKESLLEGVLCVHHLAPLVHLRQIMLNPPW